MGRPKHASERIGLWIASAALLLPAAVWVAGLNAGPLAAQAADAGEQNHSKTPPAQTASQPTVKLNFFNTAWPDVIRKIAKDTNSQLVMQRAPKGRFTRMDRTAYSRADACRVLNNELDPMGFRLVEQGQFLVLLNLDSLRTHYKRPVVPRGSNHDASTSPESAHNPRDQPDRSAFAEHEDQEPAVIETVAGVETGGPEISADATQPGDSEPAAPREVATVSLARRTAVDVSGIIYAGLKQRAELVGAGPQGLPAVRVFETHDATAGSQNPPKTAFTIGIDTTHNQLLVDAPPALRESVVQLAHEIDSCDADSDQAVQFVSSRSDARLIAAGLRPAINKIVAQNNQPPANNDIAPPEEAAPDGFQPPILEGRGQAPPQPGNGRPPLQPNRADQPGQVVGPGGEELLRVDGLRGPVTIRDVPGVGLVVTGNRDDVDAVIHLIEELDRVAGGQAPDIRLHLLQNVNAEALAALLNSVYEGVTALRSMGTTTRPSASIIPVVKPNALLIVGSQGNIDTIVQLAKQLDVPIDPQTEFQVIHLKNAIASQVVETLDAVAAEGSEVQGGLRTRVRSFADARTNSIIVQASPRDMAEVLRVIEKIDQDSSGSVSQVRVFPLKNAIAVELAEVINAAIRSVLNAPGAIAQPGEQGQAPAVAAQGATGQNVQRLREAKSVVLEFLSADANQTIRSGILADIRITADPNVNSLIVTAPEQSVSLLAELIKQLDRPSTMVAEIKVFPLTNSDAASIAQLLQSLFQQQQAGGGGGQGPGQPAFIIAGAEDASSTLVPLRFGVDTRTNSVIATGGPEALRTVEAIILRLDSAEIRQRQNAVIKLKNSYAPDVATAINEFLQSQRELADIDPELISNVELLEREIIAVAEPVTNSLLISATPRYFQEIRRIIDRLDEEPPQVVIQVLIVEVLLENTDEFGVELGFQDSVLFDRSLVNPDNLITITETVSNPATGIATSTERIISQEFLPGFNFNNQPLGNNPAVNSSRVGTQGLSNFQLGRVNNDLGFGGLVLSAGSESVNVLIRALAAKRNVQILSRPQIRTLDNKLATIQVGQQVPVITSTSINSLTGAVSPVIGTPQQVGIILQVTPRVRPDGTIVMETIANKSAIAAGDGVPLFVDPATGTVISSPIFDLTEARATVAVPDGQTVVLGGMITKRDDTLERKVPWLGDIPLIGHAFRYDGTATRRSELLVFLTPRIVASDADSELIKQVETERTHFIEQDAEEIHGPIFSVPPGLPADPSLPIEPMEPEFSNPMPDDLQGVPTTIMPLEDPMPLMPEEDPNPIPNAPGPTPLEPPMPMLPGPQGPPSVEGTSRQAPPQKRGGFLRQIGFGK